MDILADRDDLTEQDTFLLALVDEELAALVARDEASDLGSAHPRLSGLEELIEMVEGAI